MNEKNGEKKYGAIAFLPLLVFLALYIGSGLIFTFMGVDLKNFLDTLHFL